MVKPYIYIRGSVTPYVKLKMGLKKLIMGILLFVLLLNFSLISLADHVPGDIDYSEEHVDEGATEHVGLSRLLEYQNEQAKFYLKNLSFIIAFLGGILSFMLPCTYAILPAFFAYTFKEKRNLTKMTFIFFLGFGLVFTIFGMIAAFLGNTISTFQVDNGLIVSIAGILLILLGLFNFFGKGISSLIKPKQNFKHDKLGIFLFGMVFAIGWSACAGPILLGIILIASVFKSYFISALLLFSYSVGIFLPLFIISFFYDKYKLGDKKWLKGKEVNLFGWKLHSTNIISGLLLILGGVIFIIYSGTAIVQQTIIFGVEYVYGLEEGLFALPFVNIIGLVILGVFVFFLVRFLKKSDD